MGEFAAIIIAYGTLSMGIIPYDNGVDDPCFKETFDVAMQTAWKTGYNSTSIPYQLSSYTVKYLSSYKEQ